MSIKRLANASITGAGGKSSKLWDQTTTMGTYESIATATVDASGASVITFDNIPQNYTHLHLRIIAKDTNAGAWGFCAIKFNNLGTNYGYRHDMYGTGSATGVSAAAGTYPNVYVGPTSQFGVGVVDILDYTSNTKTKIVKALTGTDQNGSGLVSLSSGLWYATAAITRINLTAGASFLQDSTFSLYGIRGA